ncbi:glycosyltransferase [Calditerrivibrio nitroreducens]|uniref:glycosyltransferase n=1 Tax=Calditerrivibrio nitroreducens TaxID=477976 RepID=UPI003C748B6F
MKGKGTKLMRIVIDLQGAQTENRFRGIGRYAMSITKAIIKNKDDGDEIILALNGLFPETIEPIRAEFDNMLPQENIKVWYAPGPVKEIEEGNDYRREVAELIRESFLSSLKPDIILISSLFEGLVDDAVTSIGRFDKKTLSSVIVYDLIPYKEPKMYLDANPLYKKYYLRKIEYLKKADLCLAISDYTAKELIETLNLDKDKAVNILAATEPHFKKIDISVNDKDTVLKKFGIKKDFIMYTGGADIRKNIDGLISAFSKLSAQVRKSHQLVLVGKMSEGNIKEFKEIAIKAGLSSKDLIFTGYVSDDELIKLYNICKLFVFPSFREGFGFPPLEAMSCGAAVIASNKTSLPEVIGRQDMLFDPYNTQEIASKIEEVLVNDKFREDLKEYGINRAKRFSWDNSAKIAIEAIKSLYEKNKNKTVTFIGTKKPKLAYISPLPPEKSGISSYSKELLPYLSKYYDIEAIVDQDKVNDSWILQNIPIRNVDYFKKNYKSYDRVVYHMGNSPFHKHMFGLIENYSGVLVLHDFYISGLYGWMQYEAQHEGFFTNELYNSHGYSALKFLKENGASKTVYKYPTNANLLQNAMGIIVHSEFSQVLAERFYSVNDFDNWYIIKHLRELPSDNYKNISRKKLNIQDSDFVICSFGILDPTKLNHRLLDAFIKSDLSKKNNIKLIFVGENHGGDYGIGLLETIKSFNLKDKVFITGWVDDDTYKDYLSVCDIAVQLRTLSRGEISRAILDTMAHGLPNIVNANGTMSDFPQGVVYMLEDEFKDEDLTKALEELYTDKEKRKVLGLNAKEYIKEFHNPEKIALDYKNAIEGIYSGPSQNKLLEKVSVNLKNISEDELIKISSEISKNLNPKPRLKQLFVDVSAISRHDSKTGIQRVVKAQLKYLFNNPPEGYRIEPVYLENVNGKWVYKYAKKFSANFLNIGVLFEDEPVDIFEEDIFYAPDLHPTVYEVANQGVYKYMRAKNVKIIFIVYDILPILRPDCFLEGAYESHSNWVKAIASYADKLICISQSLEYELKDYLEKNNLLREDLEITHLHLGFDISSAKHSDGLSQEDLEIFNIVSQKPYFLMVSTIEPRKGHRQVLKAFEILWKKGYDFNLVFAGKQGWMVEDLINYIQNHPEKDKRLFWLGHISDDLLENLYKKATATIMASEGEGFGLSIIEAANYKTPIIVRDIPVFREVAKDSAYYFPNTKDEKMLANSILEWYSLYRENKYPKPDSIRLMSWQEHTEKLKEIILKP